MKAVSKITILSLLCLMVVIASMNATIEDSSTIDLDESQAIDISPILKHLVEPQVSGSMIGQKAILRFTIEANGHTSNVRPKARSHFVNDLTITMQKAIEDWVYMPLRDGKGNPVDLEVEISVKVLSEKQGNKVHARIAYGKLKTIA